MTAPTAIGAYVFGGGFSAGIRAAGFKILQHYADDSYGVSTLQANLPRIPVSVGVENWNTKHYRKHVDLVFGNPPCAAWSPLKGAGRVTNLEQDPRIGCTHTHFSLLNLLWPMVWAWESVDQAYTLGHATVDALTQQALDMGYSVTHLRFDAQYHGCPNKRRRYFMIAHRVAFDWPAWIRFTRAPVIKEILESFKAPKDSALALSQSLTTCWNSTLPGRRLVHTFDRLTPPDKRQYRVCSTGKRVIFGRPAFSIYRMDPMQICHTVIGRNATHYAAPRYLSIAESKALCGYPADWIVLPEESNARYNMLTRAVMPPIGLWFGKLIRRALRTNKRLIRPTAEMVDLRDGMNITITPWNNRGE